MESIANDLLIDVKTGVMTLTLNRPESLNSFSAEIIQGLKDSLTKAKADQSIRVIILKGAGRAFSAGGDVKRMGSGSPLATYEHIGKLNELIVMMDSLEKPIIAAVHGYAAGAGFNLALASDLILAEENSKFILSFSKVGLISDGGGLYFLPRLIGLNKAKELFFNAEPLSVEKAHDLGIVNHIYKKNEFEQKVEAYAQKLAAGPCLSYGFIKKIANQSLNSTLEEVLEQERITQATMVTTNDHHEGVLAFKEKREPRFNS
ncbi:enoyl-CoA hydratase/isomerase family protein [Cytobacillus purgationiresistens]|uniref:2-(1,2-epoxy-1,2-dihydrophenyl)acetyl-CoA isomerase n=1 Tax=Cytobacillus purgationiresistens TaxID=863449 RepID=A0ABU0AEU6_9BACI|nr:enoyl-CoA hydratase [Cytobacillus purgationiresistens]MDQ0269774.1 2-(1,2-epoxy-1,2-dihydrophenyl)acetyl-CoA isomerase [Cytobacillus purgationiresistens]